MTRDGGREETTDKDETAVKLTAHSTGQQNSEARLEIHFRNELPCLKLNAHQIQCERGFKFLALAGLCKASNERSQPVQIDLAHSAHFC